MTDSCSIDPARDGGANPELSRAHPPSDHRSHFVPNTLPTGEVVIDPWWGTLQQQSLHPQIATIGELELIEHLNGGGPVIDTRKPEYVAQSGTIPGSKAVPWEEIERHLDQINASEVTVLFCNGPQCAATPRAVKKLLKNGCDPKRIAYYRGGIHDWMSLGLPLTEPA